MRSERADLDLPLYVDLDGTLIKTDVAQELLCQVASKPKHWLGLLGAATEGRSRLKSFLSEHSNFDPASLPYRSEVVDYIHEEKKGGRRVILASATDIDVANKVADHLGVFDDVIASTDGANLKGQSKLDAIQTKDPDFEYLGDSKADVPIWSAAKVPGFVNVQPALIKAVSGDSAPSLQVSDSKSLSQGLIKAMRPHQWAKNALIFLPLFLSHQYGEAEMVARTLVATLIFCLCASAIYIINDLLDIEADRKHATKKNRPFASGAVQPVYGAVFAVFLIVVALTLSSVSFGLGLTSLFVFYIFSTSLYSGWLKHKPIFDVIVLTCLYTLRILIGGVAISTALSPWLLNFSLFFFASLAFMKRYIEIRRIEAEGRDFARGYLVSDLAAILPMGVATGSLSVLTLTLYLNSALVTETYGAIQILWLIAPLIMFWIFRAWLKALRGEVHDDPVLFALKDRISQITLFATLCVVVASRFLNFEGLNL